MSRHRFRIGTTILAVQRGDLLVRSDDGWIQTFSETDADARVDEVTNEVGMVREFRYQEIRRTDATD